MTVAAVDHKREVLLIDLSAIFRACWHANADGELSVAFQATLDGVHRCIGQRDAFVAVCCDGKGNWRKELSPEYKAHREKQPESMYEQLRRVKARLTADGFLLWECDGFEADDVIASACDAAFLLGHPVTIASHDKDLAQLMKPGIRFLKTSTWEELDDVVMMAKFGVKPSQLGDWLALVGDSSDNVKGVPGIGPKTATALLQKHGSIAGIWDSLAKDSGAGTGTPAVVRALQQNVEVVDLARKLVELRYDAPIRFEDIYEKREQTPLTEESDDMSEDAEFVDSVISPPKANGNGKPAQTTLPVTEAATSEPPKAPEGLSAPPSTTALVSVPAPYEQALEPTHLSQAQKLAAVLHNSRLYPKLANDAQIFAIIVRGRELGLGALVALDIFQIVEGRLSPSAHFIIAKAKAHPDCEYFQCIDTTATTATWETKNKKNPKPTRLTYTLEQAKAAGRVDKEKGQWTRMPAEMCRKLAGVALARVEYPEAALGLYADEEMDS